MILRNKKTVTTSVYVKSIHSRNCINYKSLCPNHYKESVVNSLLHRAYHVSSDWSIFHTEINRIKQQFVSYNFPMPAIDACIHRFIEGKVLKRPDVRNTEIEITRNNSQDAGDMNCVDVVDDNTVKDANATETSIGNDQLQHVTGVPLEHHTGIVNEENTVVGNYAVESNRCSKSGLPKLVFCVDPFIKNEIPQAPLPSYSLNYYILHAVK